MSIRHKLIISLLIFGIIPNIVAGLYVYNLLDQLIVHMPESSVASFENLKSILYSLPFFGTCGFIILGIVLSKEITNPVRKILSVIKDRDKETGEIISKEQRETNNEILALGNSFKAVYEKLVENNLSLINQSRVLNAHNDLLYLRVESGSINDLCDGFLQKVMSFTESTSGGIFLASVEEKEMLSRTTIGLESTVRTIKGSSTVIKSVVDEKKSIQIKIEEADPEGDIVRLFADAAPLNVALFPISDTNFNVRGIMMLGGKLLSDAQMEFANFASFALALGVDRQEAADSLKEMAADLKVKGEMLSKKNEELLEIDKIRAEFISLVSHELRTPLNAVIGFSELLIDSVAGELNDKQKECVSDILGSGLHLLQIVNDILDLSKIEAGFMEMENVSLDLGQEMQSIVRTMTPITEKNNQKIKLTIEEGIDHIITDRGKLNQILLNLISNASKFSHEGSVIEINVIRKKNKVLFSIADEGIGIPEKEMGNLFKPFVQVDSSHTRNYEGTGLGLAICKKLIESFGGEIWVESSLGEGSTFFFTLLEDSSQVCKSVEEGNVDDQFFRRFEEEIRMGRLDSTRPSRLIFHFDDVDKDSSGIQEQLVNEGYEVIIFKSETELIRAADMLKPDVITFNFIHPQYDEKLLLDKLEKDTSISEIPRLFFTDDVDSRNIVQLYENNGKVIKIGDSLAKDVRHYFNEIAVK